MTDEEISDAIWEAMIVLPPAAYDVMEDVICRLWGKIGGVK